MTARLSSLSAPPSCVDRVQEATLTDRMVLGGPVSVLETTLVVRRALSGPPSHNNTPPPGLSHAPTWLVLCAGSNASGVEYVATGWLSPMGESASHNDPEDSG